MKTSWKFRTAERAYAEIDGFWVEALENSFWVGNGDSEDLFVWAENDGDPVNLLSETWELKIGNGATDLIADEAWERIISAVGELRAEQKTRREVNETERCE